MGHGKKMGGQGEKTRKASFLLVALSPSYPKLPMPDAQCPMPSPNLNTP
ncbi:hypothetical protein H6H03_34185 [Nostoc paludosum FACHB-159]|uniref:Uncharacterized protein n=1 Tax=Nostoc paludosum FACHB-159 TaxID=2692908 RepID=A0ABR8KLC7_9NOSO|nr:hypothetical protein [Nostoc paludosum FACHB-159]